MSEPPVRENPIEKAAAQLRLGSQNLPTRPLSLWDAEYGCASEVTQTADKDKMRIFVMDDNECDRTLCHDILFNDGVSSNVGAVHLKIS